MWWCDGGSKGDRHLREVRCACPPLVPFLVTFCGTTKSNCLRGMSANDKPQKSSGYQKLYYKSCFLYLKISAAWVFRLCGGQLLFVVPQKVTKKGTKEDRHNALRASACPPWNPHHNTVFSAVANTNPPVTS